MRHPNRTGLLTETEQISSSVLGKYPFTNTAFSFSVVWPVLGHFPRSACGSTVKICPSFCRDTVLVFPVPGHATRSHGSLEDTSGPPYSDFSSSSGRSHHYYVFSLF